MLDFGLPLVESYLDRLSSWNQILIAYFLEKVRITFQSHIQDIGFKTFRWSKFQTLTRICLTVPQTDWIRIGCMDYGSSLANSFYSFMSALSTLGNHVIILHTYILKVNQLAVIYFWAQKNWRKKCVYRDNKISQQMSVYHENIIDLVTK